MKKLGFTLIELLIVIAIVGILLALGTASYLTALKQSRDTRRKTDLEQIRQALETYRSENGFYPSSIEVIEGDYIAKIPSDPKPDQLYFYNPSGLYTSYALCATLEIAPSTPTSTCDNEVYNYELTNP